MPDFTSALYLGLTHSSGALKPWRRLTTGRPAVLGEPAAAAAVAGELAALQGCEAAMLMPSTLHGFVDVFEVVATRPVAIFLDAGLYPIARVGAERLVTRGVPVMEFAHHDRRSLRAAVGRYSGRQPVVVVDGYCPDCGRIAPLGGYLTEVRRQGGLLVIDDTQALGILGAGPHDAMPYGLGGGGSLVHAGVSGPDILVGASLAKAFGAPLAVLSGSRERIASLALDGPNRVHSSPPSAVAVQAAAHALAVNRSRGDGLRRRLLDRVQHFRRGMTRLGWPVEGGLFPVQSIGARGMNLLAMHRALERRGIRGVPLRRRHNGGTRLGFLITAAHRVEDIDRCLAALKSFAPSRSGFQPVRSESLNNSLWR